MLRLLWVKQATRIFCYLGLIGVGGSAVAEETLCSERGEFIESGWQQQPVKDAMDRYLREHRIRINWQQEPRPPSAIGRDYYEWLWQANIGAAMKNELVARFCD